jgi:hypothetical protein
MMRQRAVLTALIDRIAVGVDQIDIRLCLGRLGAPVAGINRIWISSSVTLGNGVAATSHQHPDLRSAAAQPYSGQRFPISWARAASLRGVAGSAKRVEVAWQS